MTYQETINWLYTQYPSYQKKGLSAYKDNIDHIRTFLNHNQGYLAFNSIHVAGTNGKGSVSHMLSSILQESGYKVGLFTSPHLIDFRERIKINGKKISEQFIVQFIEKNKSSFTNFSMSFFEMNVLLAFKYFSEKKVDIAIIETGLGGRLDTTNVINPILSIITNVALDHMNLLGNSIEKITKEKAGIIKKATPVLIGLKNDLSYIFEEVTTSLKAPIYYSKSFVYDSDLKGTYQKDNINTSVTAINILRKKDYNIDEKSIINGLNNVVLNTGLLGRWQLLKHQPEVICDIAHNEEAIKVVTDQLLRLKLNIHMIIGFSNEKDIDSIISLLPKKFKYYICGGSNERVLDPDKVISIFQKHHLQYKSFSNSPSAYNYIKDSMLENELIFITGSTFIVSDILKYFEKV